MRLFGHPPRNPYTKLPDGYTPFVYLLEERYDDSPDVDVAGSLGEDMELAKLMNEVKRNGYGDDLVTADGESLLTVVDVKLRHPLHKLCFGQATRAEMLAVVLYAGCECNYAMCAAERESDYTTWRWFRSFSVEQSISCNR